MFDCRKNSTRFAKCNTKREVIDVYTSQLESLQKNAQHKYAIDPREFRAYVRFKICRDYSQLHGHHHRRFDANDNGLFSERSLKKFAKFVTQRVRSQLRRYFVHIAICAVFIVLVNYKTETSKSFMRNIQTLIYPVMRAWRKTTLPLLKTFPSLSNFYDETCLLENPFFRVANLDCTPCTGISRVIEHSGPHLSTYLDYSVPHIVQVLHLFIHTSITNLRENLLFFQTESTDAITIPTLFSFYLENRQHFRQGAYIVRSNDAGIRTLDQLFDHFLNKSNDDCFENSHSMWHINRMIPARMLRKMFATPMPMPTNAGIGIDRYVIVDSIAGESYELPTTDCANMFVYQASGSRQIHLQPTKECHQHCRQISVRLKQNHIRKFYFMSS